MQSLSGELGWAILDHVAHPIFVKNRRFRFVFVNAAFCELAGFSRDDMLGRTDFDFFPREQSEFFRQKDVEMFASERTIEIDEEPITDARGGLHVLATTKVPLRGPDGSPDYLVGIIHDITRRKEAEKALLRAKEALERRVDERTRDLEKAHFELLRQHRLSAIGELSARVAHQIRNPLAAISNSVAILRRRFGESEDGAVQLALRALDEEVWQANRIITDLLDYAKVRPPVLEPRSLTELVHMVIQQSSIPDCIELALTGSDVKVSVDQRQVRQAISNVVSNAVEAMGSGGRLALRVEREGDEAILLVEDTGPGIPPERLGEIFEPLVTFKPSGLGLGLAIAKAFVEDNNGGTIVARSEVDEGTVFRIAFPAVD